jgi:uncharacterized membrane protein (DUF373 family)
MRAGGMCWSTPGSAGPSSRSDRRGEPAGSSAPASSSSAPSPTSWKGATRADRRRGRGFLLDRVLLLFIIAGLPHTLRVLSIGGRILVEPFVFIGLIAIVRKVLVLTAEVQEPGGDLSGFLMQIGALASLALVLSARSTSRAGAPRRAGRRHRERRSSEEGARRLRAQVARWDTDATPEQVEDAFQEACARAEQACVGGGRGLQLASHDAHREIARQRRRSERQRVSDVPVDDLELTDHCAPAAEVTAGEAVDGADSGHRGVAALRTAPTAA